MYGYRTPYTQRGGYFRSGAVSLIFDSLSSVSNVGIWSLRKERSDYTGYAVRVDDDATSPLDIGFNADGSFDWDTYAAYGGGDEKVTIWYDQSGNEFNLLRAVGSYNPVITQSAYNGEPCIYWASSGSMGIAAFTDWNGLADANFITAMVPAGANSGVMFSGGVPQRNPYFDISNDQMYWFENGYSAYNLFDPAYTPSTGHIIRWQFDGGAATDLLQARYYLDTSEVTTGASGAAIPTTLHDETGFYVGGGAAGTGGQPGEYFCFYYIGQDYDPTDLNTYLVETYFTRTDSNVYLGGDSLTYGIGTVSPPTDANAYPQVLKAALEAHTSTTWNFANGSESAAQSSRVEQLHFLTNGLVYKYDAWQANNIFLLWCGTNDLGAGDDPSDPIGHITTMVDDANLRGWDTYVLNCLPRQDLGEGNAAFETARGTFNTNLATAMSGKATMVDVAGISELADPTDTNYYAGDDVHLNAAGYALIASEVYDTIVANIG